jgi:hypothetical protein
MDSTIKLVNETQKIGRRLEEMVALDLPTISLNPERTNVYGDIFFHDEKYFIGDENSRIKGGLNTVSGRALVYLIANVNREFSKEEIALITQTKNKEPLFALIDIKNQLNCSSRYSLEVICGKKYEKHFAVLRRSTYKNNSNHLIL